MNPILHISTKFFSKRHQNMLYTSVNILTVKPKQMNAVLANIYCAINLIFNSIDNIKPYSLRKKFQQSIHTVEVVNRYSYQSTQY